jgi:glycogen debranching enzyme
LLRRSSAGAVSVVQAGAGYRWFTDWGHDTFITLRGRMGRVNMVLR